MTRAASARQRFSTQRGFWLRCFLGRRLPWRSAMICCCLVVPIAGWAQLIDVPCKGTAAQCAERNEKFCATAESSAANLKVQTQTRIWGVLIDPSGAVFAHPQPGLTVELRDPKSSRVLASSKVSETGTFDLGPVSHGNYRLIAVLIVDGKTARYRGWEQPKALACGDAGECTLAMLLRASGTDNPVDFCPPR
jgi:hypothetical protein